MIPLIAQLISTFKMLSSILEYKSENPQYFIPAYGQFVKTAADLLLAPLTPHGSKPFNASALSWIAIEIAKLQHRQWALHASTDIPPEAPCDADELSTDCINCIALVENSGDERQKETFWIISPIFSRFLKHIQAANKKGGNNKILLM